MCTVVLSIRVGHEWPVVMAANRDERLDRPWALPAAHWPTQPGVIAARDLTAGGTWIGLNATGVVAAVLNRPGTLGPAQGKRSRGELPLLALAHASAAAAAAAIADLPAGDWRPFNMVIADRLGACFVRGLGRGRPEARPLPAGVHIVTAHDPNDLGSPRVARHLDRFRAAVPSDLAGLAAWQAILADRSGNVGEQINVTPRAGFGTACSSLLALPRAGRPVWLFAAGAPDTVRFEPVALP